MRAAPLTLALRGAAALALLAALACSSGTTPDCSDAQCGTFTVLPLLDATLDTATPDAGEDSGDAEEEGDDSSLATSTDAALDSEAGRITVVTDAADDGHATDSGHDDAGHD